MIKLYNTQCDIASNIREFLHLSTSCLHKTQLNILPFVILGMISAESSVSSDIAKFLKDEFTLVQFDSVVRRIQRLFHNPRFDGYSFYNEVISFVINNFKLKHSDNRVHIIFDHMFSKDNYTIFMISMRIGKQGIPLYFECFKGINNPTAFTDHTIIKGIDFVSNLFSNKNYQLVFLADRWFNSYRVLKHVDSLNHTYCTRLKGNLKAYYFNEKEKHYIKTYTNDLFSYQYHSNFFNNIYLYDDKLLKTNITISKKADIKEPWIIATNGDATRAIKDYSYRFGGIETIFKNQKSNGFYIEDIKGASLQYFINLYATVCFSVLFLTILGADYSKNKNCYKNVKITTHKNYKNKGKIRILSLFNTGLILFKRAFNSIFYIRIPFKMILYDI